MNGFSRGVVLAACLGLAVVVPATAEPPKKMIRIEKVNYRLLISVLPHSRGLKVTYVAANSPARRMILIRDREVIFRLEEGDIITKVNDEPADDVADLEEALAQSGGKRIALTVRNVRNGKLQNWWVTPVRVRARVVTSEQ